ncbi:hypothetical protein [Leptospira neocaledonica]|uniref:Uncharacterized protein n=1 Tax=Leptospira neocaledonica TaxID=2023192 RepID=A0A2N0A096_9LEPT|nr:hypothetical protein [Leptospira neocaledonica]PJZ77727.1 hypothetical protein CH365_07545 [Leptospira neocaledonica]
MELIESNDWGLVEGYCLSRPSGVNIGIEKITFSFPIEDVEKLSLEKISIEDKDIPEHSKIEVQVSGRKVYLTYPLAQLFSGLALPGDSLDDEYHFLMKFDSELAGQKGCAIRTFENMEIEKLHLIQLVNVEGDDNELFQLQLWLIGNYNGAFYKLEETEDLINGGKVRRIMEDFWEKDDTHWKKKAQKKYQVEFNVVLENAQSVKDALGKISLETLNEDNLKKVMNKNAKVFFNSLGFVHPLLKILENLDIIEKEMGSVWRRAVSMKYPDNYESHRPGCHRDTVEMFVEYEKNLQKLKMFIKYLTRGLVDPLESFNSNLNVIEKLGKELVGPEFSIELRY